MRHRLGRRAKPRGLLPPRRYAGALLAVPEPARRRCRESCSMSGSAGELSVSVTTRPSASGEVAAATILSSTRARFDGPGQTRQGQSRRFEGQIFSRSHDKGARWGSGLPIVKRTHFRSQWPRQTWDSESHGTSVIIMLPTSENENFYSSESASPKDRAGADPFFSSGACRRAKKTAR